MALQFWLYSFAWGAALALMASGLALYYSVSKVANFAHGEYVSVGVIAYLILVALLHGFKNITGFNIVEPARFTVDKLPLLLPIFIIGGLVSAATFAAVFWPLMKRGSSPLQLMVVSIGLMFVLRFILYFIASAFDWLTLPTPESSVIASIGGVEITAGIFGSLLLALIATIFVAWFTRGTMIGVSMRAVADNPGLAEASGINVFLVQLVAWFIGGGLAAVGGALMFILTGPPGERPIVELGWMDLLPIFAATVLGGLGSFYGTLVASFILGLAFNEVSAILLNYGLDPSLALAVPFGVTLAVLLFMPEGLAGLNWGRLYRRLKEVFRGAGGWGS